jgi:hypothetical protein
MQVNPGLRGLERNLSPMPSRVRPEPACLPIPSLRITLVVVEVDLLVSGFSHFSVDARFRFRRSFASNVTAPTDRTVGEGIPFPPSPRVLG